MLSLIFIIFAAINKAIIDTLQFHYDKSWFAIHFLKSQGWWNPKDSWKNKYKNHDITKGEAFWGATTVFCWITDAWHFFQSLYLNFIFLAIVFFEPIIKTEILIWSLIINFIIYRITFGFIFEIFFRRLNGRNNGK